MEESEGKLSREQSSLEIRKQLVKLWGALDDEQKQHIIEVAEATCNMKGQSIEWLMAFQQGTILALAETLSSHYMVSYVFTKTQGYMLLLGILAYVDNLINHKLNDLFN